MTYMLNQYDSFIWIMIINVFGKLESMSQTSSAEAARPPAEVRAFQEGFLQALCTIFLHSEHMQHFNLQ